MDHFLPIPVRCVLLVQRKEQERTSGVRGPRPAPRFVLNVTPSVGVDRN